MPSKHINAHKRTAGKKTDTIKVRAIALAILDFLLGDCAQFIEIHKTCSKFLIKFKSNIEFNNIKKNPVSDDKLMNHLCIFNKDKNFKDFCEFVKQMPGIY